jgi:hypothetical protein
MKVSVCGHEVFREHPFCCMSALEVASILLVGYEVFLMVSGLGTLVWTGRCAMICIWVCGLRRFPLINRVCMVFGSGFPY